MIMLFQKDCKMKEKKLVKKLIKTFKLSNDYAEEEDSALKVAILADIAKRKKKINIRINDGVAEYLEE